MNVGLWRDAGRGRGGEGVRKSGCDRGGCCDRVRGEGGGSGP